MRASEHGHACAYSTCLRTVTLTYSDPRADISWDKSIFFSWIVKYFTRIENVSRSRFYQFFLINFIHSVLLII